SPLVEASKTPDIPISRQGTVVNSRGTVGLGHFYLLENALDHLLGGEVLRLGFVRQRDAVAEDVVGDRLHVLGRDEPAVPQERVRARREVQVDGRARRGAVVDVAGQLLEAAARRVARREYYTNYVILHFRIDVDVADHLVRLDELPGRHHRVELERRLPGDPVHDQELFRPRRIADLHLEHEPVDLSLGQRVGALLLDRVLRRQHEERRRQRKRLVADGDLLLLHALEQGALHLGGRAVDLVGEDQVGE